MGLIAALVHSVAGWDREGRGEAELVGAGATVLRTGSLDITGKKSTADDRMAAALDLIAQRQLDIVGFQGMRAGQHDAFKRQAGTRWATYPASVSASGGGRQGLETAIAWRTSDWILVSGAVASVADDNGGTTRRPYVLLQHRGTGRQLYVLNADLPLDTASRSTALEQVSALVNSLQAYGHPVLLTGRMNTTTGSFCALTTSTPLRAANGGSFGTSDCKPPAGLSSAQLYGSGLVWSGYRLLDGRSAVKVGPTRPVVATAAIPPLATTSFRVATFNVLGFLHTVKGGDRKGFAGGNKRTVWAERLLRRNAISVVGLQEFQPQQWKKFHEIVGASWVTWPGDVLGRPATHNSLAWRADRWEVVSNQTIPIPYFGGGLIRMPYALLRDRQSGREVWFANFHNPANTKKRGNQAKWRRKATRLETQLMNKLVATGKPVVLTGDMNDRADFFCPMTAGAPMAAANGGSRGPGTCALPAKPRIDWILGSYDVGFTGYTEKRGSLVRKTTDHPLIYADATLDPTPPATTLRAASIDVGGAKSTAAGRVDAALGIADRNSASLLAFQGMRSSQHKRFRKGAGSAWATYPAGASRATGGKRALSTAIAWRASTWTLIGGSHLSTVGTGGAVAKRPYVLLQNRLTGRRIYVANASLPTDAASRTEAVARQVALVKQLQATGNPVVLVGRMNDTRGVFCAMTGQTTLRAANGGSRTPTSCSAPRGLTTTQLYGGAGVTWSNYTQLGDALARRASAGPVVLGDAFLAPLSP